MCTCTRWLFTTLACALTYSACLLRLFDSYGLHRQFKVLVGRWVEYGDSVLFVTNVQSVNYNDWWQKLHDRTLCNRQETVYRVYLTGDSLLRKLARDRIASVPDRWVCTVYSRQVTVYHVHVQYSQGNSHSNSGSMPTDSGSSSPGGGMERLSSTNLYIRKLPPDTTDKDLLNLCQEYAWFWLSCSVVFLH